MSQQTQNELVEVLVQAKLSEYLAYAQSFEEQGGYYKKHTKALTRIIKAIENGDFE